MKWWTFSEWRGCCEILYRELKFQSSTEESERCLCLDCSRKVIPALSSQKKKQYVTLGTLAACPQHFPKGEVYRNHKIFIYSALRKVWFLPHSYLHVQNIVLPIKMAVVHSVWSHGGRRKQQRSLWQHETQAQESWDHTLSVHTHTHTPNILLSHRYEYAHPPTRTHTHSYYYWWRLWTLYNQ